MEESTPDSPTCVYALGYVVLVVIGDGASVPSGEVAAGWMSGMVLLYLRGKLPLDIGWSRTAGMQQISDSVIA